MIVKNQSLKVTVTQMMSPMHKKVAAASSLITEWASALRNKIGEPKKKENNELPADVIEEVNVVEEILTIEETKVPF